MEFILESHVDAIKRRSRLLGKIAYSILLGVAGTILLALFLSFFMPAYAIVTFVPWLIAFNTAVTGYALSDRTASVLKKIRLVSAFCGLANALIVFGILCRLMVYATGERVFSGTDLALYVAVGVLCSELGTLLNIKYVHLKKRS